jgi:hypothetical protein
VKGEVGTGDRLGRNDLEASAPIEGCIVLVEGVERTRQTPAVGPGNPSFQQTGSHSSAPVIRQHINGVQLKMMIWSRYLRDLRCRAPTLSRR